MALCLKDNIIILSLFLTLYILSATLAAPQMSQKRSLYSTIYHKGKRIPYLSDLQRPHLTEDPYAKYRNKQIPETRPRVSGNSEYRRYTNVEDNKECCEKKEKKN